MSNKKFKNPNYHNYSQYSKPNEENEKTMVKENFDVKEVTEEAVEESVEETTENKSNESTKLTPVPIGVVKSLRLNIRRRPDIDSDPLCVVEKGYKLKIDKNYENDDWFKVVTPDNVSGYCMLKFVDVM